MGSAGMKQQQGEKRADYIARVQAAQREEAAARAAMLPRKFKRSRKPTGNGSTYGRDMRRGEMSDDLGESHD